jgi:hypothetical protein
VVLPEGVHLEEGLHVELRIREAGQESPEELFKKRLVEVGLLEGIRRSFWPLADQDRTPIQVEGKLLSDSRRFPALRQVDPSVVLASLDLAHDVEQCTDVVHGHGVLHHVGHAQKVPAFSPAGAVVL